MMDLKMEVYSPALELLGILEVQRSVIWEKKAFSSGSFSVESIITDGSLALLQPENIIWIEGDTAGIIEYVQRQAGKDGPYITVKGQTLTGILGRRVLWKLYDLKGTTPEIMHKLVDDCCINPTRGDVEARKIPGLVMLDPPSGGDAIRVQKTGGTLLEALEQLGETYGVAFGVRFNPAVPQMEFWTRWGQDRSIHQTVNAPVLYSTELDDVLSSEYSYNSQDYRNVALVAGEGEGNSRVYVTVENEIQDNTDTPVTPPTPPTPTKYTITLSVDPAGGGVASGGKTVASGVSITVTAAPADGYAFAGWQENGAIVSTDMEYTFTVTADRNLTAVFAAIIPTYTVTVSIDPSGSGTVTGAGTYREGEQVTVSAVAADGYMFSQWMVNGAEVGTGESYTFTVIGDVEVTAVFTDFSKLPAGYTEVEYLDISNVYVGFDTGVKAKMDTTGLVMDFRAITYSSASGNEWIFSESGSTKPRFRLYRSSTTKVTGWIGNDSTSSTVEVTMTSNRRLISYRDHILKIGSTQIGKAVSATTTTAENVYLFGCKSTYKSIKGKLYSAQMYESSDLIRDWVPCTDPSGEAGLFDLVEKKFYKNAWSGTVAPGPAV